MMEPESTKPLDLEPIQILPNLYLGSYFNASQQETIEKYNIKRILNLAKPLCLDHFESKIEYKSFGVANYLSDSKDLNGVFESCFSFINSSIENHESILVHCAGMARSSSIVVAYLMKHMNLNYDEAFGIVKSLRSDAKVTLGFKKQILAL